eukprot:SAG11_NODE_6802_length_1245_cov_3.175393_1_plen_61_part_00
MHLDYTGFVCGLVTSESAAAVLLGSGVGWGGARGDDAFLYLLYGLAGPLLRLFAHLLFNV